MSNAELLVELKNITKNSDEYEELLVQKENIENQIKDLKAKLSDEDNYQITSFDRDSLEKTINDLKLELERSQVSVSANSNKVQDIEKAIEVHNELISEDEKKLEEITDEVLIEQIKRSKEYLQTDLAMLMTSKESLNAVISHSNERIKDITLLIERYGQIKEDSKEVEVAYSKEKIEDENKLSELESNLEQIDSAISYFNDDVKKDIKTLIAEIEGEVVDSVDIYARLLEIKIKLEEKEQFEKIEEVKQEQDNLEKQIGNLEDKLSDSVNYTPSVVDTVEISKDIEVSESNISDTEQIVKEIEFDIHKRQNYVEKLNASIEGRKAKVEELNIENAELKYERTLNPADSKAFDKQIDLNKRKIKRIEEGIERCEKIIISLEQENSLAKKNKKSLENLKNRDIKDLNAKKLELDDKKTVDALEMSKDKKQLSSLIGQLAALKAIESLSNAEINATIDNLITNYFVTTKEYVLEKHNEQTLAGEPVVEETVVSEPVVEESVMVEPVDQYDVVESTAEFVNSDIFAPIDFGEKNEYVSPEGNVDFEPLPTDDFVPSSEEYEPLTEEDYKNGKDEEDVDYEELMSVEPVAEPAVKEEIVTPQVVVEEVKVLPVNIVTIKDASLELIEKVRSPKFTKELKERLVTSGLVLGLVAGAKQTALASELPTVEIDKLNDSIIESEEVYSDELSYDIPSTDETYTTEEVGYEAPSADTTYNFDEVSYEVPSTDETYTADEVSYEAPSADETYTADEVSYEVPSTDETYITDEVSYEVPSTDTTYDAVETSYEAPSTDETYATEEVSYGVPSTDETYTTDEVSYGVPSTDTTYNFDEVSYDVPSTDTTYNAVETSYETSNTELNETATQTGDFYDAIETYASNETPVVDFYQAGSNYEKIIEAEKQVSDTTPEFEYTPVSEDGYEAPEEFVIGGETVNNEEVNNTYSDLTKEEEDFLAALMQQQKEDTYENSKSL